MGFRDRKFGTELEFFGPKINSVFGDDYFFKDSEMTEGIIKWNLMKHVGISFKGSYKNGGWLLEEESLNNKRNRSPMELSSAVLQGPKGMRQLKKVASLLSNELDCIVDKSCGLHVHVDVSDLSAYEIAAVVARYVDLEKKIDCFVAPSRRGNRNIFCHSPKEFLPELVWKATAADNRRTFKAKFNCFRNIPFERQSKVNIEAVTEHGTLEFRHHQGTLDPERIEVWIKFCINFIEQTVKDLKGYRLSKNNLPELNHDIPEWIIGRRAERYPRDVSYAFRPWSKSPLKGLPTKTRKVLNASI